MHLQLIYLLGELPLVEYGTPLRMENEMNTTECESRQWSEQFEAIEYTGLYIRSILQNGMTENLHNMHFLGKRRKNSI